MSFYAKEGEVFFELLFNERNIKQGAWKKILIEDTIEREERIIKCQHCNKPAVRLDNLYPYHSEMNACEEHLMNWDGSIAAFKDGWIGTFKGEDNK